MINLRPSNASFWSSCQGWFKFINDAPNLAEDTQAADTGISAHDMAAKALRGESIEGDEELIEALEGYRNFILETSGAIVPANIEQTVWINEELGIKGTPDYWVLSSKGILILHIFDFKFGHKHVAVFENPQVVLYAEGVLGELLPVEPDEIHLHIYQPRDYHSKGPARTWVISREEFQTYVEALLITASLAKEGGDLSAGGHCLYCTGRHICPSLNLATGFAFDFLSQPVWGDPDPGRLGKELSNLTLFSEMLKARKTGLEAQITSMISGGTRIPGYWMEQGVGRQVWNLTPDQIIALGSVAGVDLAKPTVVTPRQAEKKGFDPAAIKQLTDRPKTGLKLVPDDGKHAEEVFGK